MLSMCVSIWIFGKEESRFRYEMLKKKKVQGVERDRVYLETSRRPSFPSAYPRKAADLPELERAGALALRSCGVQARGGGGGGSDKALSLLALLSQTLTHRHGFGQ